MTPHAGVYNKTDVVILKYCFSVLQSIPTSFSSPLQVFFFVCVFKALWISLVLRGRSFLCVRGQLS